MPRAPWRPSLISATVVALAVMSATCRATAAPVVDVDPVHGTALAWTAAERATLATFNLRRLPPVPVDPSNRVERRPEAIALGERIFNDTRFSRDGRVSCASCHDPARQFQDGRPVGQGVGVGTRRVMPLRGAGHATWLFWDGRKDSLWSQALGPLEDGAEHGGNRTHDARVIAHHYRAEYEALFDPLPRLDDLPADASPLGNAQERQAWAAMSEPRRREVSRVFANMGKALAAYEKTLAPRSTRFDRYLDALEAGSPEAARLLGADEVRGLRLFIGKGQCASCHAGPLLTDQAFHDTGVPPRFAPSADRGRAAAMEKVLQDEFNCLGPFSDAPASRCQELRFLPTDDPTMEGAFRTPGLRGVAQRAPYMHAGQFATLEEVVRHYVDAPEAAVGVSELASGASGRARGGRGMGRAPIRLNDREIADLVSFLRVLDETGAARDGVRPAR